MLATQFRKFDRLSPLPSSSPAQAGGLRSGHTRATSKTRLVWALRLAIALLAGDCLAAQPAVDPLRPHSLAPSVFAFFGEASTPSPANRGMVGNQGVIVGSSGLIVIGTGTSNAHGERLLEAIRRLSDKPVVLAVNAYAGPEHVLGNSAFARRGIPVLAHRETDRYMAHNCDNCIRNLATAVGPDEMAGSRLERPSRLLDGSTTLQVAGRTLDILHFGTTQQAGALAVFDRASGILFAGGLASFDVVPDAHDADIAAWIAALQNLRRLPLATVLPGRGPAGPGARLDEVADYLQGLAAATAGAYRSGTGLREATQAVQLQRYEGWALYPSLHGRNVHREYLRLEAKDLGR